MNTDTSTAMAPDDFDALEAILDDLRERHDEIPQWEFCEGFLAAVVCTREPISDEEAVDALLPEVLGVDLPAARLPRWIQAAPDEDAEVAL